MDTNETDRAWRNGPAIQRAGLSNVLRSTEYALRRFRTVGIPIPTPCRLLSAREIVQLASDSNLREVDMALLAEATRTIFEFYYIARSIGGSEGVADELLRGTVGNALSGPLDLREEDENTSRPRNTQFELFLGAWLTSGGATIKQAEPDLQLELLGQWLGVAAKRVRSRTKILRRVKEAAEQVRNRTSAGLVALSVDRFTESVTRGADAESSGKSFEAQIPELLAAREYLMSQAHIRGLIVIGSTYSWAETSPTANSSVDMISFTQFYFFANSDQEKAQFDEFLERFDQIQRLRLANF